MTKQREELRAQAAWAINVTRYGDDDSLEEIEAHFGGPLSGILDRLWFEADEAGLSALSKKIEQAYTYLTTGEPISYGKHRRRRVKMWGR
jgi:hypothetical protein